MSDETPRAYTKDEVRDMFIRHVLNIAATWGTAPRANIRKDFNLPPCDVPDEILTIYMRHATMGMVHTLFSTFDGRVGDLPGFNISPAPHPEDQQYRMEQDRNWWPDGLPFNDDVNLHDQLRAYPLYRKMDQGTT